MSARSQVVIIADCRNVDSAKNIFLQANVAKRL